MPRYSRNWTWPNDAKIAVSVNLAFEWFNCYSIYAYRPVKGKRDPFSLSAAEYAVKAGAPRILDLLDTLGVRASMSTNGSAAETFPQVVKEFADAGHEIVGHSWFNDEAGPIDDIEEEREIIRRCTEALTKATGGTRPVGWTSPGAIGSENTQRLLKEAGYLWNGDDMSDDLPFLKETGSGPIVIMPRTNVPHNDIEMWLLGKNPPSVILEGFKDTFDMLYAEGIEGRPKWTEITVHLYIGARPTLIPAVRRCVEYAQGHPGVYFGRKRDIAEWALQHETKR